VRTALVIAVPLGVIFTLFAWRISELLSPDAIGMALGMLFGVLAGLPAAALVIVVSRRTPPPPSDDGYIDVQPTYQPTYADEVTPYTHLFRRAAGMPALHDRQATIDELRSHLAYLEDEQVSR